MTLHNDMLLAGAAHVDRLGQFNCDPIPGTSNPGHVQTHMGGATLNIARICSAFSFRPVLHSILGDDTDADHVKQAAQRAFVSLMAQQSVQFATASYTAFMTPMGEVHAALADMRIYETFDGRALPGNSKLPLCVDANLSADTIAHIVKRHGGPIVAVTVSASKAAKLALTLGEIDVLVTNRRELHALANAFGLSQEGSIPDIMKRMPVQTIVTTDGASDVWVKKGQHTYAIALPDDERPAVDATGCGDAVAAAVLCSLVNGEALGDWVYRGILAAGEILRIEGPWSPCLPEKLGSLQRIPCP